MDPNQPRLSEIKKPKTDEQKRKAANFVANLLDDNSSRPPSQFDIRPASLFFPETKKSPNNTPREPDAKLTSKQTTTRSVEQFLSYADKLRSKMMYRRSQNTFIETTSGLGVLSKCNRDQNISTENI